ncbi:hypothetical protein EVAR_81404_1 [Eumeta japonica]|uniref:Uncharacterized protein n=1 Tax=Eumeta variegata TaxID=151549 RepID=A0A4C1WI51_EUMVA|nr:hypothetical protein EVAR_81404_1 [Eumeta japonica]
MMSNSVVFDVRINTCARHLHLRNWQRQRGFIRTCGGANMLTRRTRGGANLLTRRTCGGANTPWPCAS